MDLQKIIQEQVNQLIGGTLLNEDDFAGWVNVKIDNQVKERVEKLLGTLGFGGTTGKVREKIKLLSDPLNWNFKSDNAGESVSKQISALMVLQYLHELKQNFAAPSAGFLFEYFMAGLIPGVVDKGNNPVDVVGDNGYGYQLKLYRWSGYVDKVSEKDGEDYPNYYLVGYKKGDDIHIYQMTMEKFDELLNSDRNGNNAGIKIPNGLFRSEAEELGILQLGEISEMSQSIAGNLTYDVEELWKYVSQLHFSLEAMVSGVNGDGGNIDITSAAREAENSTSEIDEKIKDIKDGFLSLGRKK